MAEGLRNIGTSRKTWRFRNIKRPWKTKERNNLDNLKFYTKGRDVVESEAIIRGSGELKLKDKKDEIVGDKLENKLVIEK